MKPRLLHFTPLPPAHNGIADYAYLVLEALQGRADSIVVSETPHARAPSGVPVLAPKNAQNKHRRGRLPVYQIGNNWQHTAPLREALTNPGLVVLHDLQLLYLYESLNMTQSALSALVKRSNAVISADFASRLAAKDLPSKLPYMLANMLADIVAQSKRLIVHSQYGRMLIARHFGAEAANRVDVVPHFAIQSLPRDRQAVRRRLGVEDRLLILTAGFATKAKQMEFIAQALAPLVRQDRRILWVHAGSAGDEHYSLETVLQKIPEVAAVTRITGYLSESSLDDHVAAADLVINLRFPSVGESSGSLARALASGACALVTDTGGYAEYPSDTVLKIDPLDSVETLSALISKVLQDPSLRRELGKNAASFAEKELSMEKYVDGFLESVGKARKTKIPETESIAKVSSKWIGPIEEMGDEFDTMGGNSGPVEFERNVHGDGIFVRRRT